MSSGPPGWRARGGGGGGSIGSRRSDRDGAMSVGSRMTTATTTVMHGEEMHDTMRKRVNKDAAERLHAEEELLVATATGMSSSGVVAAAEPSTRRTGSGRKGGKRAKSAPRGFRDTARDQLRKDLNDDE